MEKYIKFDDIKEVIKKLIHEPAYQHEDESFYTGVCAVDCELSELPISYLEPESPTTATKGIHVGHRYFCSNCGKLSYMENYCSICGAKVIKEG